MEEIENIQWHIIGLSEVRRNSELLMNIKEGHLLYRKDRDDIKQSGVGFLINKEITKNIKEFHGEFDRVASFTLKLNRNYNLKMIQVYAPTSSSTQETLEESYDSLLRKMNESCLWNPNSHMEQEMREEKT